MSAPSANSIIAGAEIPSIPHVLQRILKVAGDPASSSRDLENLIVAEPGLVTHLLRTVNSAGFGSRQRIASINHAIVMLGFSTVKSIVSGLVLIDVFNNMPGLDRDYVLTVWQLSLAKAELTKLLARSVSRERREEVYLAAMVMDIGHLVLAQYDSETYARLRAEDPFPAPQMEIEALAIDHAEVGAALLDSWNFSDETVKLVSNHHRIDNCGDNVVVNNWLNLADLIMRHGNQTLDVLDLEEDEINADFLTALATAGWSWREFRMQREVISNAIDFAHQIVKT